jgi:hypothetical protein
MAGEVTPAAKVVSKLTEGLLGMVVNTFADRAVRKISMTARGPEGESTVEFTPLPPLADLDGGGAIGLGDSIAPSPTAAQAWPEETFDVIVGLDWEKRLVRRCVCAPKPIPALLVGKPASAKSMFLEDLERLPDSRYMVGGKGSLTAAGILSLMRSDHAPHILLVDEIDKCDRETQDALLTMLETGRVTRVVSGDTEDTEVGGLAFIAAANHPEQLTEELRSRLYRIDLPEHDAKERHEIIVRYLTRRENVEPKRAAEIAALVAPTDADVRRARHLARLGADDPAFARELAQREAQRRTAPLPKPATVIDVPHRVVRKRRA